MLLCPLLLYWGRWREDDDDHDNQRGNEDVHDVQNYPPTNTQQPAILGGDGDCDSEWDGDGNGDGDSDDDSDGNGDDDWQWQR